MPVPLADMHKAVQLVSFIRLLVESVFLTLSEVALSGVGLESLILENLLQLSALTHPLLHFI